ncbi:hypothetical protein ACLNAK_21580 [Bacillus sp. AF56]|nr:MULTISPECIES: hypothetical protein [unclassified Bacillus (in: firmicutes)]
MYNLNKDNIYYGFGGEHYVIAQFYTMQYEATKMEVDFGFDILVTNQYRYSRNQDSEIKTWALQIKTVNVTPRDYVEKEEGGRGFVKYAKKDFYISKNDFDLITSKENGYLVCAFVEKQDQQYNVLGLFWLSSEHLKEARENKYIIEDTRYGEKYVISARIPVQTTIDYLTEFCLEQSKELNAENEYFHDLRNLLRSSHVVPYNPLRGVELIKEETAGDKHACYAPLTKELTGLKSITDDNQYSMIQNLEEYYKRMHEMDSVIIVVENKKFQSEFGE